MGLSRSQRVAPGPKAMAEGLELSPQEYFVLSRVEGTSTVGDVVAMSGMGAEAERIVERLLSLGVLQLEHAPGTPVRPSAKPMLASEPRSGLGSDGSPEQRSELRRHAQDRRRKLLEAQLGHGVERKSSSTRLRAVQSDDASSSRPEPPASPGSVSSESSGVVPAVSGVASVRTDDPRIDPKLPIPVEDQRRLLGMADVLEDCDHFVFLGLEPTDDLKAVRRSYHVLSRKLHPDAYYGRDLGPYRSLLSTLFHRAKVAYTELTKAEVRQPLVQAHRDRIEAERQEIEEQRERAERAQAQARSEREEQERSRRRERAREQARHQRERLMGRLQAEAAAYVEQARKAEAEGKLAQAANLYRLALRVDPSNELLAKQWEDLRGRARKKRAADAFSKATTYVEIGHTSEAIGLFVEAADSDPTPEHLAHAADAVRGHDPTAARRYALAALDALRDPSNQAAPRGPAELAGLHVKLARAFLAAGQTRTATEQARIAERHRPNDPEVGALLKSLKVT